VQGVNASAPHGQPTALDGELVSRRYASPIAVGFVAFAIVALLLVGGRRQTRTARR
jgi:hypothetical protein